MSRINDPIYPTTTSPAGDDYLIMDGTVNGTRKILAGNAIINPGTTAQYFRGDKTWQTLNQAAIAGLTIADTPTFAGLVISGTTDAVSSVTGSVKTAGGLGVAKAIFAGTTINAAGTISGAGVLRSTNGTIIMSLLQDGASAYVGTQSNHPWVLLVNGGQVGTVNANGLNAVPLGATTAATVAATTLNASGAATFQNDINLNRVAATNYIYYNSDLQIALNGTGAALTIDTSRNVTLAAALSVAGGVKVTGGSFITGSMYYSASLGLVIAAKTGSSWDFSLYDNSGTTLLLGQNTGAPTLVSNAAWTYSPAARTSGVAPYFTITPPADTGQTASTESNGYRHLTATRTWAVGTVAVQRENFIAGPTYAGAGATATFTDAFTLGLTPPIQGTNAAITRNHTLGILDATSAASSITGGLIIAAAFGTAATSVGIGGGNINAGGTIIAGTGLTVTTGASNLKNTVIAGAAATTALTITQTARTSGVLPYITWTIPTDTGLTAATEAPGLVVVTGTRTWATTGTVAAQREVRFVAPTYASASASQTFTKSATVSISGAPIQGTNAILGSQSNYSLWIESGRLQIDGVLASNAPFCTQIYNDTGGTATVTNGGLIRFSGGGDGSYYIQANTAGAGDFSGVSNIARWTTSGLTVYGALAVGTTLAVSGLVDLSGASAGQIKFPATANPSANANTLDDYAEGTWTPSVGGTATYSTQTGTYTKIGRVVYFQCILLINTIGTGSTSTISGLPFVSGGNFGATVFYWAGTGAAYTSMVGLIANASSSIQLNAPTAAASTIPSPAGAAITTGTNVQISGFYFV